MKQALVRLAVFILSCSLFYSFFIPPDCVYALPTIEDLISKHEQLKIPVNKSQLVLVKTPVTRVSIVAPEVADVQILDPKEILVSGKSVGQTSLVIWVENGQTRTIDVAVEWDTSQIQEVIRKIMPDQPIEVISLEDSIALRGQVSEIDRANQAIEIAQSFVPKVVNLLIVPGTHQVLLKVRIAEVSRSFRKEKGIGFHITDESFVGGSLLGDLISADTASPNASISDSVTLFFSLPKAHVSAFIQTLQEKGLMHMLAEPNLIARSGETASFLVGGQFPVPIPQGIQGITVEYKEYGVRLNFTPTVVTQQTIQLDISPEVSDLDFAKGVQLGGFVIPVIVTRRAHTVVKLDDGQTFAIAGLISQSKERTSRKAPPFGDIPVLGGLFRGGELRAKETELLIMVTPHLIAPIGSGEAYKMPVEYSDSLEREISVNNPPAVAPDPADPRASSDADTRVPEYQERLREEKASHARYVAQSQSPKNSVSGGSLSQAELLSGKGVIVTEH
jgi:pilus assembly protein CpaC